MLFLVVVPILAGITIAVQAWLIGGMAESSSPLAISLALMLAGVCVGSAWSLVQHEWGTVGLVVRQWWWVPLGVAGWIIVAVLGWSANRLGVATALGLVVASQLVAGAVIDVLAGEQRNSLSSMAGALLVTAGALLMLRPS